MFFLNHEGRNVLNETVRLTKRKEVCNSQQVYLRVNMNFAITCISYLCDILPCKQNSRISLLFPSTNGPVRNNFLLLRFLPMHERCAAMLRVKLSTA